MFDRSHLADHMNHGATTCAGVLTMASNPGVLLSYVGALIGVVGVICSISREVRGWLDRRAQRLAGSKGD